MKTSEPTICSTACSPLTARLSMTMSLYGRRPSVVLSLVIWTSLITTPSSDTTSLPMYDLKFCYACRDSLGNGVFAATSTEGPPAPSLGTLAALGAGQDERDVIAT